MEGQFMTEETNPKKPTWWQDLKKPLTRRQCLELALLAALCTAVAIYMYIPLERLPPSSFESVEGSVAAKNKKHHRRYTSYKLTISTAEGERQISMDSSLWSHIRENDRIECLLSCGFAVEIKANGDLIYSYEDYCRKREREARRWATFIGAIAALAWFGAIFDFIKGLRKPNKENNKTIAHETPPSC
jgi:hypothetical protein